MIDHLKKRGQESENSLLKLNKSVYVLSQQESNKCKLNKNGLCFYFQMGTTNRMSEY